MAPSHISFRTFDFTAFFSTTELFYRGYNLLYIKAENLLVEPPVLSQTCFTKVCGDIEAY